jgi:hypothetical protein
VADRALSVEISICIAGGCSFVVNNRLISSPAKRNNLCRQQDGNIEEQQGYRSKPSAILDHFRGQRERILIPAMTAHE